MNEAACARAIDISSKYKELNFNPPNREQTNLVELRDVRGGRVLLGRRVHCRRRCCRGRGRLLWRRRRLGGRSRRRGSGVVVAVKINIQVSFYVLKS